MTEQEKADIALLERGGRRHNMFMTLPLERRTEVVCNYAVESDGENIRYVPRYMRTEKLCYTAVRNWDYALDYVPEELKTPSMCMAAVERYGPALLLLWFDVERGCNTTYRVALRFAPELCFDVEGRSITFAAYKMKRSDVVVEACIIQP